jgi:antirestriction protein ArdC
MAGRGAPVRKGEQSTTVVFWKFDQVPADNHADNEQRLTSFHLVFARGYPVFNAAQVDGYAPEHDIDLPMENRIESAEKFFGRIPARVLHQSNRAFYSVTEDTITLPSFGAFFTPIDYYNTVAHEAAHWTSKAGRCNRELRKRLGDDAFALKN